ncbi:MAG: hypothetical protein V5A88_00535 [Candidatus Thermoplasmatota archaeon]
MNGLLQCKSGYDEVRLFTCGILRPWDDPPSIYGASVHLECDERKNMGVEHPEGYG